MANSKDDEKTWPKVSVIVNVLLLFVTWSQYEENKKANEQLARANANAAEAGVRAAEQTDAALELQRQIAAKEDERSREQRRQERAPLLIVKRCCNQTPISIQPALPSGGPNLTLRRFEKLDQLLLRSDDELRARSERPFVVRIANVGAGVAIGTKAFWEVEKVVSIDGRLASVTDDMVNGHMKPYTWPATIQPNETADLLHLPTFLEYDSKLQVSSFSGYLLLTCKDSANESHEFRSPFTMETVYKAERNDELNGTRLSFHFYEPGSDPSVHIMAKLVLEPSVPATPRSRAR